MKVQKKASVHERTVQEAEKHQKANSRAKKKTTASRGRQPVSHVRIDQRVWKKAMEISGGDTTRIVVQGKDSVLVVNQSKRKK